MSFSKRSNTGPDPPPAPAEFNANVCNYLADNPAPFKKFPEAFLCFVGISRYYELDDNCYPTFFTDDDEEMDLFAFIHHGDPTKVRIGEREVGEGEVPLLELTRGRVIPSAGVNEQGNKNEAVQDVGAHVVNEKGGDAAATDQIKESDHVVQDEGANIVHIEDEIPATVVERAKGSRKKRKTAGGASGSSLPPKKLRADHGTFGSVTSSGGKFVAVLQSLLERSTLPVEVGVTVVATLPFITSSMSLTLECEGVAVQTLLLGPICGLNTQRRGLSLVLEPPIMTTTIATTVVADTSSIPVPRAGEEPVHASIFADSTSAGTIGPDIAGPSQPAGTELSADTFYVSQDMDSEMLHQIYVPKRNVVNEYALDDPDVCRSLVGQLAPPVLFSQLRSIDYEQLFAEFNAGAARQTCLGAEVRMRLEHELRGRKKFEGKWAIQDNLLKEKDAEIASLKAQLSLKEAEAAEAIRLRGQVATVEATEATRVNELNGLKEHNSALEEEKNALEHKVAALESANVARVTELASLTAQTAKLTQDLSELGLSCDELSVKASTLEVERDRLVGQDEQVRVLSEKVAGLDADLMGMALHLDEEFYPCFLTTIAGRRWILGRGFKLAVMKCLQSPKYLTALGGAIGHAIDKGMQDGLAVGIDHRKGGRSLADVAAYNPSAEANYISAVNALRPAAETPEASQLQPSLEQLMLPIHYSVPPVSVANYEVSGAGPSTEFPSPPKIVFEMEEWETTPEHTTVADILSSRKELSIAVHELVRSVSQCFRYFVQSFPLRAKLPAIFCMAGIIVSVHQVSRLLLAPFFLPKDQD
ncbi:hypothetical protein Tco_0127063 [Tanacetum coccineum]